MKKLLILKLLMAIAIIAFTAFQVYWLMESFRREKASLALKTSTLFKETVLGLQAHKFRIVNFPGDSIKDFNFEMTEKPDPESK